MKHRTISLRDKLVLTGILLLLLLTLPTTLARAGVDPVFSGAEPESAQSASSLEGDEEYEDGVIYTLVNEQGDIIAQIAARVYVGDEYISADNSLYRVVSVDDATRVAVVQYIGVEGPGGSARDEVVPTVATEAKHMVAVYHTHSDESYIPTDGTESLEKGAGIYDVGEAFAESMEKLGVEVVLDDSTHLPHDAGAYRRSRVTATRLMEQQPAALIDIHRDGIPDPDEYVQEIDGEPATKVRLLVGRSNPNAEENREFAKEIKQVADEMYPDLIKDIFIGKGNYNQELMPRAILLEFGTHTISKERALTSTDFMANVMTQTLFGGVAKAEGADEAESTAEESTDKTVEDVNEGGLPGWAKGLLWTLGAIIVVIIVYGLVSTGSFGGMWDKIKSGSREIGGGLFGKRKNGK